MNATDAYLQDDLRKFLQREGRDLILELAAQDGTYDTDTNLVTSSEAEQVTVRGRLYRKKTGNFAELVRAAVSGSSTEVSTSTQKAVIEARTLNRAPKRDDYIVDGETRYRINKVEPKQGAEIVLSYEIFLDEA